MKKIIKYLIACMAILIWLGLLANHWPTALAIAVIGGIIWRSRKSLHKELPEITPASDPLAGNTTPAAQLSSSMPPVTASIPGPVITFEYNLNRSVSRSTMPGTNEVQWASYNDMLEVASYRIEHPMTYWAAGKTRIAEASCIEKNLPIGKPISEPIGALGYWPRYENMTPGQRGNYLSWLASGKQGQLDDIGYAFVYFYGLERRFFIDGKDVDLIIPEVVRLLCRYPESGSFNGYLSRFIAFSTARMGLRSITNDGFALCFDQAPLNSYSEDLLAVILAWFYQHNLPLPGRWAFEVARQDVRTMRSVVINRAPEQFKSLFMQKYHAQFAEGMVLKAAERERLIEYHPASPSLMELGQSSTAFAAVRIPDVLGLQSQFVHLSQIWNTCVEELRDFSRAVGKGLDTTTREAWEALPPALRKDVDHPDAPHWKAIATTQAREDGFSFASISKLAEIQKFQSREKLTATQSRSLARTAEDIGLAIVPDARITGRAYAWSDEVVLFQQEGSAALQQESGYRAASCMLELGMVIAGADGKIDPEENARIEQFLEDQFRLSSDESRRLKAYGILLGKKPPSISSLGKSLREALTLDQRAMIGKYLIGVAAANGIIDLKEISSLKSIYKALEIEAPLDSLLAELRQSGSQPVEVQTIRREQRVSEAIPQHEQMPVDKPVDITLNNEALTRIMAETAEVSRILGQALCETESKIDESDAVDRVKPSAAPEAVTYTINSSLPFSTEQLAALDKRYYAPLAEIMKEQVWSSDDLAKLAKRHQLMRTGMLDTINSWAYDSLGDEILFEEDNMYKVNQSLVGA
ncbi:MAG: Tellurite resistance protein TerB [Euryarchaeota archaeon]|nr:Tellurite resistance protein TerB [Euryarchaeota archaeon]